MTGRPARSVRNFASSVSPCRCWVDAEKAEAAEVEEAEAKDFLAASSSRAGEAAEVSQARKTRLIPFMIPRREAGATKTSRFKTSTQFEDAA